MSCRFTLYYWPIPFRAQFARYLLAYRGEKWDEPGMDALIDLYQAPVKEQPMPFMAAPFFHDAEAELWLSQAPAITSYLGGHLGLMPGTPEKDALTLKVICDCIDVLQELTLNCGAAMWDDDSWAEFAGNRFVRWLEIFEAVGARHGLQADDGTLLGTSEPGVADLVCAALWVTICDKLPELEGLIAEHAPNTLALSNRIGALPQIASLRADQKKNWGNLWCEGEIEKSLRTVLANWQHRPDSA